MQKKYFITTYGCQLNVHESEKLAGIMEDLGYSSCEKVENADVIIFNTCAIREGAEDRAVGNIGALKGLKKKRKDIIIAVCGCMTQQKKKAEEIYNVFPFVDIVFGTSNLHEFKQFLLEKQQNRKRIMSHNEEFTLHGELMPKKRTSGENAWVNIMQGCNNFCSYCIVPYVRGRERSRKSSEILEEIKQLLKENKYKKITLLGQNVNSYGKDLSQITDYKLQITNDLCHPETDRLDGHSKDLSPLKNNNSFANLLKEICKLEGDFKLGFMTSHPKDLTSDVIDVIASEEKILKEIHLPVQSGSNKILMAMNRKYTAERYLEIIEEIKQKIPEVRITTDILVGFPGEDEDDFKETLNLIKKVKFAGIFAFIYSKRQGTPAEKMENQVDEKIKNRRVNECLAFAKQVNEKLTMNN